MHGFVETRLETSKMGQKEYTSNPRKAGGPTLPEGPPPFLSNAYYGALALV